MIEVELFKNLLFEHCGKFPFLTLGEFFDGNTEEDSIAPNQCGFGRPTISEMYAVLKSFSQKSETAWIRVSLHSDSQIFAEKLNLSANSIVICSRAKICDLENLRRILCADWIYQTKIEELRSHYSCVPKIPDGFSCFEIEWD